MKLFEQLFTIFAVFGPFAVMAMYPPPHRARGDGMTPEDGVSKRRSSLSRIKAIRSRMRASMDPYEGKERSNQMQPTTASRVIYIANKNPEMMPPSEMSNSGRHMKKIRPTGQIVRSMDPDRTRNMNDHSN